MMSKRRTSAGSARQAILVGLLALTSSLLTTEKAAGGAISPYFAIGSLQAFVVYPDPQCSSFGDIQSDGALGVTHAFVATAHSDCGGFVVADGSADVVDDLIHVTTSGQAVPQGVAYAVINLTWGDSIHFEGVTQPTPLRLGFQYRATQEGTAAGQLTVLGGSTPVVIDLSDTGGSWLSDTFETMLYPGLSVDVPLSLNAMLTVGPSGAGSGSWDVRMVFMGYQEGLTCSGAAPNGWVDQTCSL